MNITWKELEGEFANGLSGHVGKWKCFEINWRGLAKNKTRDTEYSLYCCLPGVKRDLGAFDIDGAKARAQKVLEYWLKNLNEGSE